MQHARHRHYLDPLTVASIEKQQGRITWDNNTFSDYVTLAFPAEKLRLRDIDQHDLRTKLQAAAQLRYVKALAFGRSRPDILAFARLSSDRPASQLFPGIDFSGDSGETLFSANSALTWTLRHLLARGWLRFRSGGWTADVAAGEATWRDRGQAVLDLLQRHDSLYFTRGPGQPLPADTHFPGFPVMEDLIPVDRLGFVRDLVWREAPLIAFNTTYFLLEHNDFISHHSALGEPYNLFVSDGQIRRPPLYRRSALCQNADGRWRIEPLSLQDLALRLPTGLRLVPATTTALNDNSLPFVVNQPGEVTLYTRRQGIAEQGRPAGKTPVDAARFEITVIDRRAVSCQAGGGLEIPQNGLVISFDRAALPQSDWDELLAALAGLSPIEYEFIRPEHLGMRQAVQVGPQLLRDGQISLDAGSLDKEDFWISRTDPAGRLILGVVPTDYPNDVDRSRAGRGGVGILPDGRLVLAAVPSTETGVTRVQRPEADSYGATLLELAELLREAGAVDAVNLDGGGSTQVFFLGGAATTPGNRLGLPGIAFERMVPSAGVVT